MMPDRLWYKYRTRNKMDLVAIKASRSIKEVYIKLVYGRSLTVKKLIFRCIFLITHSIEKVVD